MCANAGPDTDAFPTRLTQRDQWICWRTEERDGKETKIPIDPAEGGFASVTDPDTWTDIEKARAGLDRLDVEGVGFVFSDDDDIVGVDLDDCRDVDADEPTADAHHIIDTLASYTEVSPSGTGYHVLVRGDLPSGGNRSGFVEMYDTARFFTVTGDHVQGTPETIKCRSDELAAIHEEYVQDDLTTTDDRVSPTPGESRPDSTLSDEELLERARNAANGPKFQRLWRGDTSGYESHSEADMALCFLLAFWTGGDPDQMDRLFRQSGLMREKWDEVHYADGATYGERTIERARAGTSEFYDHEPNRTTAAGTEQDVPTDPSPATEGATEEKPVTEERVAELSRRLTAIEATVEHLETTVNALQESVEQLQSQDDGGRHGPEDGETSSNDEDSKWFSLFDTD